MIAASSSQTAPLYERDRQLSVLEALFADAHRGRGTAAVVRGPAGSGKTEVLSALADRAADSGAVLLSAAASRAERAVPYAVLAQLLHMATPIPRIRAKALSLLRETEAVQARMAGREGRLGTKHWAHVVHRLGLRMLALLDSTAAPVLVTVDDAHCADEASLQCLANVVRRSRATPVFVVCTESTDTESPDALLQAGFAPEPQCQRLGLDLLSLDGVRELLARHFGLADARRLAPEFFAVTRGNPQIVRGLIEDNIATAAEPAGEFVVASGFSQAVLHCLYRCTPATLALAREIALIDEPIPVGCLAMLAGLDRKEAIRSITALESMGVLTEGRFRHPAVGYALLNSMNPVARADAYARTARLLYEMGVPAMLIARKLLLVAGHAAAVRSVPLLHEAAEQALDDGETDLAVGILRLAYLSGGDERNTARTVAMLARAERRTDPYSARRWTPHLTSAVVAGHIHGRDGLAAVDSSLWFGDVDKARELLRRIDDAATTSDSETLANVRATWLWQHIFYRSEGGPDAQRLTRRELTDGLALSTSPQAGAAVIMAELIDRGPSAALSAEAELCLDRHPLEERSVMLLTSALAALMLGDQLTSAARWADSLARDAEALSAPVWYAQFTTLKADIALRRGALREALRDARSALVAIPRRSWGIRIGVPLSILYQSVSFLGRNDETLREFQTAVPDAMFQTLVGAYYFQGRGRALVTTGQPRAALRDFFNAGELVGILGQDRPALISWRSDAAHVLTRLDQQERARELAQQQFDMCTVEEHRSRAMSLRALAAACGPESRVKLLTQAMEELQNVDARLETARVLNDLGAAHQERGEFAKGRALLRTGRQIREEIGAVAPPSAAAKPERTKRGAVARVEEHGAVETLSDAEMRVAILAASGHSNRQIASKLFITISTVEQHLTRVYRKLNIARRGDIALKVLRGVHKRVPA